MAAMARDVALGMLACVEAKYCAGGGMPGICGTDCSPGIPPGIPPGMKCCLYGYIGIDGMAG